MVVAAVLAAGCGGSKPPLSFADLTQEFVQGTLALSPVGASVAGYHRHGETLLDERLDDYRPEAVEARLRHWRNWDKRLEEVQQATLDEQQRADLQLMKNQVKLARLQLEKERSYTRNPSEYVEVLGQGLFTPYSVDYAPLPDRCRHLTARLKAAPGFLSQAKAQLKSAPGIWSQTAIRDAGGIRGLLEGPLASFCPAELQNDFKAAAAEARAALVEFEAFLAGLPDEGPDSWRMNPELYREKFQLVMGASPEEVLAEAEAELRKTRRRMFDTALPLHTKHYPTHRDPVDLNLIVGEVLEVIARQRPTRERYFAEANAMLEEARAFVRAHQERLAPLPPRDNLKIIETPAFMRGFYSVGGFHPAPPLQPNQGAFYWLTPFEPGESAASVESRLREYNNYGLRILTLHEAIPGHYLQFEYAAGIQPEARRVLRSLFGSGVYIEGWAVYSNAVMLREGYLNRDPALQLTFDKQMLRVIANAILDIRFHQGKLSDEEALELMRKQTFQEEREAANKLVRAKLSSTQLPTYFVGYRAWENLRAEAEKRAGAGFSPRTFHTRALEAGALPMPTLRALLLEDGAAR
jgi:uncharacterized protein (DUF885 family)